MLPKTLDQFRPLSEPSILGIGWIYDPDDKPIYIEILQCANGKYTGELQIDLFGIIYGDFVKGPSAQTVLDCIHDAFHKCIRKRMIGTTYHIQQLKVQLESLSAMLPKE
jgi:hypothetical protein